MDDVIKVAVCFFCHDGKGNVLFNKRSQKCRDEQGRWDIGAGALDFGERILDGLRREVKEEYCADVLESVFMGARDNFREQDGKKSHWVMLDFKVLVDPAQVRIGEPEKCDGLQWLPIHELKNFSEPMHSQFPIFLEKNKSFFV